MALRLSIVIFFYCLGLSAAAQGIQDSVFNLKAVEIKAKSVFAKENAGMKRTDVDSVLLMEKVNSSLSELLSENTPVFIKDYGRGALATASFRGTAPTHTKVNWNGLEINSPMTGMVDFSLIPVYLVDEMNLKHGAASIIDQGGSLGGSVNIQNTPEWNNAIDVKYNQGIGSYRTFNEFLQFGIGSRKFRSQTRLYHNYSKNNYTFINRGVGEIDPETGDIINPLDTNKNAGYTVYGVLQEFYYRPDENNVLSAKWWFQDADRALPKATSYEGPVNSNLNRQNDRHNRAVIDWKHYSDKSRMSLMAGYSSKQLDYKLENLVPGLGLVPAVYSESSLDSYIGRFSYSYDITETLSVETSLDANWETVDTRDSVAKTGYNEKRSEISWFAAIRKGFGDRLNVNLMLRQDWVDYNIVPLTPYIGFDLRIVRNEDLFLKGNIARNYHQPALNDLYWQPGGNPDLLPEEGFSFELGMEYSKDIENHSFMGEVTAFRSDIDNWIIWIPGYKGYWEPDNIKRVVSQGVEFYLKVRGVFGRFSYLLSGNYAYTSSLNYGDPLVWGDESYGKQLPYIPRHSGNVLVKLSYRKFFINWQHNSYSERFTTSSNDVTRRDRLYPYYMNDLGVGKEFKIKKLGFMAEFKIYNLFNETYHTVLYRPMPGRNYLFSLMIKY